MKLAVLASLLGLASGVCLVGAAEAQQTPEVRARLERGVARYEEATRTTDPDRRRALLDEALAEFDAAYQSSGAAILLLNLAEVHAELGQPVEASMYLERMLAETGGTRLPRARRAQAEGLRERLRPRVGALRVETSVAGATVLVDGAARGETPLDAPIRVAAGLHTVSLRADGYVETSATVRVAGEETAAVSLDLVRASTARAQLDISSPLHGVEVRVDGTLLGVTPLAERVLAVDPGRHVVEGRRPGYHTMRVEHTLDVAELGTVRLPLERDPAAPQEDLGRVSFVLPAARARLRVDGGAEERGDLRALALPVGHHRIELDVAERVPIAQEIEIDRGRELRIEPALEWTPEARRARTDAAGVQRLVGWSFVIAGAGAVAVTAGLLTWYAVLSAEIADLERRKIACGGCAEYMALDEEQRLKDSQRDIQIPVSIGLGIAGAAALGVALFILLRAPSDEEIDREASAPTLSLGVSPSGILIAGGF